MRYNTRLGLDEVGWGQLMTPLHRSSWSADRPPPISVNWLFHAQVLGFPLQSRAAEGAGGDALADELPVLVPSSAVAYFDQVVLLSILANTLLMTFMHYEDSVNM